MRRLKVLWLSHFVPYPPKGGAFQRSFNLIRAVGAVHELHLLALHHKTGTHPAQETRRAAEELGHHCASVEIVDGTSTSRPMGLAIRAPRLAMGTPMTVSLSDVPAMHAAVRRRVRGHEFDLVHFDTIGLACYLKDVPGIPAVLSHHGAESFMMLRRIHRERNAFRRALYLLEGTLLRRYESRFCPRFVSNVVVSDLDSRLLADVAPRANFKVVPNGVDTGYFQQMPPVSNHRVVFAGRLDQYSNRDAILHFSTETWPRIRARFPDAALDILGSNPPRELESLARTDPSIRVHGFVDDVRPFFRDAAIAVCPIRDGGGTRVKILDNLAMGKPIVSTTIGIEGIDVVPDRDLLIADSPTQFESQVARLFADDALRARLSRNARAVAERLYSWDGISVSLTDVYEHASRGHRPSNEPLRQEE